jgi:cell wall-active antibiotic response 4TMS protein YvqF
MNNYRYRSFFWPAILILVGLIALLVNTGRLPSDRLYLLFDLWPVILILIGLEIIIRRSLRGASADLAAALVLLLALGGAIAYIAVAPGFGTNQTLDATDTAGNLQQASLEVDAGAATISISGNDSIGGDLYHAHIEYNGPKPTISLDRGTGSLKISQSNNGFDFLRSQRFVLTLELNTGVTWSITENTGAATDTLNLSSLKVASMSLNTGASREDITLGPPSGSVSITINGGALTAQIHRPGGTPASVRVAGGAVTLDADGHHQGAIGNASYQTSDYDSAADRYDVSVNGGACTVTLDSV